MARLANSRNGLPTYIPDPLPYNALVGWNAARPDRAARSSAQAEPGGRHIERRMGRTDDAAQNRATGCTVCMGTHSVVHME